MIRSDSQLLVKSWLPLAVDYIKFIGLDDDKKEEAITLVYTLMDKIEFDFTKLAGICL